MKPHIKYITGLLLCGGLVILLFSGYGCGGNQLAAPVKTHTRVSPASQVKYMPVLYRVIIKKLFPH